MVSAFTPTPLFGSEPTLLQPPARPVGHPVTLFAVQGGMLMPIKVGGCSRSLAD